MHAAFARKQIASLVQLWCARQRTRDGTRPHDDSMYLAGKNRLLPRQRAVVSFGDSRCRTLSAMADRAPELIELVRNDGMRAERLSRNIGEARLP